MSYSYINSFSIYPSARLERYRGLPGYPQKLYPPFLEIDNQIFDKCMLQLLNDETERDALRESKSLRPSNRRPDGCVRIQLKYPYPIITSRLNIHFNDDEHKFSQMRDDHLYRLLLRYTPSDICKIILSFEKDLSEEKNDTQWKLSLDILSDNMHPFMELFVYKTLRYTSIREDGKSGYLQVHKQTAPITRVIFGYFLDSLLQDVNENPDNYLEFFRKEKGEISYSHGVFVVHYNDLDDLPLGNNYIALQSEMLDIPVPYRSGYITLMLIEHGYTVEKQRINHIGKDYTSSDEDDELRWDDQEYD